MDRKLISEAIDALDLMDIHLYSTSIKRFEDIDSDNYPDDMSQHNKISVSADFLEPEDENDNSRLIHAKVEFGLKFLVEDTDSEITNLAEIDACFIAKYHQSKEISEEAISEFMKFNVVHNVWPFWREHAFRSAAQAKLPTPMVSLYKPTSNGNA
jgi:ferritin-like protein